MTRKGLRLLDCVATQGHDTAQAGALGAQAGALGERALRRVARETRARGIGGAGAQHGARHGVRLNAQGRARGTATRQPGAATRLGGPTTTQCQCAPGRAGWAVCAHGALGQFLTLYCY